MNNNRDWNYHAAQAIAVLCFVFLLYIELLTAQPFPFSDDWHFVPYAVGIEQISWDWLWHQHVDHRIPLQKLIQVFLLQASSVDFRVLVLANAVFAYLVTVLLLRAVRSYRGRTSIGDFLFPLILMNPGFGPFHWGFHFQFMSSVLLVLCSLAFILLSMVDNKVLNLLASGVCLLLLAFCGMNGAILAGIISFTALVHLYAVRPIESIAMTHVTAVLFATALAAVGVVFFSWQPSGASRMPRDAALLDSVRSVMENWFLLITPHGRRLPLAAPSLYYAANSVLYAAAIVIVGYRLWANHKSTTGVGQGLLALASVVLGGLALLLSIAIGRSSYWSPGLEVHYGYLAVILPLASWIIISTETPKKLTVWVASGLLFIYGAMYLNNLDLVQEEIDYKRKVLVSFYSDAGSGMPVAEFVAKHIPNFFYIDTEHARKTVESGILLMKNAGIQPYTHLRD